MTEQPLHLDLMMATNACLLSGRKHRDADRDRLQRAVDALGGDSLPYRLDVLRHNADRYLRGLASEDELREVLLAYAADMRLSADFGVAGTRVPMTSIAASAHALEG